MSPSSGPQLFEPADRRLLEAEFIKTYVDALVLMGVRGGYDARCGV